MEVHWKSCLATTEQGEKGWDCTLLSSSFGKSTLDQELWVTKKKKMVIFWQTMMWSPTGGSRFVLWVHNLEYVNIFLLKIFILLVFTVYVCITVCLCMWAQVKTLESPELELKWLWVPHCRTWGLNLGPLKSKCVLVTTEPSLSPLTFSNATFFLGLSQSQIKWWLQRIPVKTTEN